MKTLFTIALLISLSAYADTIRCVKNPDGSVTCVVIKGGGF